MTLLESFPELGRWDAKVLATDIDTDALRIAAAGAYSLARMDGVEPARRQRWFDSLGDGSGGFSVSPTLRRLLTFKALNLLEEWPMRGPFDAIFCRNVFIYFDRPTKRALVDRFTDLLADDGFLFLGHSESLLTLSDCFEVVGPTIHRLRTPERGG